MEVWILYAGLFWSFLKVGLFGFGGGYAMLSLLQNEVVTKHGWISSTDFTDIVAISQVTPGPIAFNTATYIGYTATGSVWGAALCTIAVSLPSFIIMTIVCRLFLLFRNNVYVESVMRLLKPALIGLIASVVLQLIDKNNFADVSSWVIFAVIFLAALKKVDPILLIVVAGVFGWFYY
ncbi:chromate transporter [Bacteroidia bacterium]|nr:chromate transporter [Bacteroidia bacterium]